MSKLTNPNIVSRRIAHLLVSDDTLLALLRLDGTRLLRVEGVPADACLLGAPSRHLSLAGVTVLRLASATFRELELGEDIPEISVTVRGATSLSLMSAMEDAAVKACSDELLARLQSEAKYGQPIITSPGLIFRSGPACDAPIPASEPAFAADTFAATLATAAEKAIADWCQRPLEADSMPHTGLGGTSLYWHAEAPKELPADVTPELLDTLKKSALDFCKKEEAASEKKITFREWL